MVLLIDSKVGSSTAQSCSVKSPASSGPAGVSSPGALTKTIGKRDERSQLVASKPNGAYVQVGPGLRASSMLDIAEAILVLASVCIFLAHAVDTYRAQ
jgi:hypothetical protein